MARDQDGGGATITPLDWVVIVAATVALVAGLLLIYKGRHDKPADDEGGK